MSSFMADIGNLGAVEVNLKNSTSRKDNTELKMEDFLKLMVVQLQSQTIDDTADTGEMLNQLVQMQMVTALSNMTDASVMSYASSLVGKEITIATVDKDGNFEENVLNVTGTGVYGGQQVVFCDDGNMYQLNQILAVGRIPETKDEEEENPELFDAEKEANDRIDKLVNSIKDGTFDPDKTGSADSASNVDDIGAVKDPESAQESNDAADFRNEDGTVDPLKGGLLDGMLVNPNPADEAYTGEQGAPKDGDGE